MNIRNLINSAKVFGVAALSVFVMGACKGHKSVEIIKNGQKTESNNLDTLRVYAVYDLYNAVSAVRTFGCVDKYGNDSYVIMDVGPKGSNKMGCAIFVERGDTIVLKGNEFISNLTTDRIRKEFITEKQK